MTWWPKLVENSEDLAVFGLRRLARTFRPTHRTLLLAVILRRLSNGANLRARAIGLAYEFLDLCVLDLLIAESPTLRAVGVVHLRDLATRR